MRQRAAIALALALDPRFVVFDEPTTALDVLVQAAVMRTIGELQRSEGFTAILISHDLGLVLEHTDRVMVMHEGEIVEDASAQQILTAPCDDYTKMLLSHYADPRAEHVSLPGIGEGVASAPGAPGEVVAPRAPRSRAAHRPAHDEAIVVDGVTKIYKPSRRREEPVVAVDDVSFTVAPGAAVALVGASGSGKSTLTRLITGIERPTSGRVSFGDRRVDQLNARGVRKLHEDIQLVFQDPYAALNPLHRIGYILSRGFANFEGIRGSAVQDRVIETLEAVGLTPGEDFIDRLPHELSGGQRQRVVIARALACNPRVIVADEPVSMLDVTLRAGILALLDELRRERGVSLLYITHDLLSARVLTDEIVVLEKGRVVESGITAEVLQHPQHEYSKALIAAAPNPWSRLAT
jgi:peptide/nickel transport system ATP-binding protein